MKKDVLVQVDTCEKDVEVATRNLGKLITSGQILELCTHSRLIPRDALQ